MKSKKENIEDISFAIGFYEDENEERWYIDCPFCNKRIDFGYTYDIGELIICHNCNHKFILEDIFEINKNRS